MEFYEYLKYWISKISKFQISNYFYKNQKRMLSDHLIILIIYILKIIFKLNKNSINLLIYFNLYVEFNK